MSGADRLAPAQFAVAILRSGTHPAIEKDLLEHQTTSMVERYAIRDQALYVEAIAKLALVQTPRFAIECGAFVALIFYTAFIGYQSCTMREATEAANESANAATCAAQTARKQFELSERPRISVKIEIAKPLTFTSDGKGQMDLIGTFENVGRSVATDFLWWADMIPFGRNYDTSKALDRQTEWCEANEFPQYPKKSNVSGGVLFPYRIRKENIDLGLSAEQISTALANPNMPGSEGKMALLIPGCVVYRAPFSNEKTPSYETTFMYYLAFNGGSMALFRPDGIPSLELRLAWVGNSAR